MSRKRISRRKFAGAVGSRVRYTFVPRHVLGRGYRAPSDKLNVACIGVGGMGRNDVRGMEGENIYALCDVDWKSAEDALQTYTKAKRYKDYREMFDKESKNIDAVTVSTPDHSHAAAGMLALKAGKHTYIQKPLARTMGEVRALADYARSHPKIMTQMGNQGHARDGTRQIRELVEAGAIGSVREVHFWTNRPIWPQALDRPLEAYYAPATLDWKRRQADRGDVRGRRQAAHVREAGRRERRSTPTRAAAEVPALARRLRRVDRGVQGRAARGLDVRWPRGRAVVDGTARVSRGTAGPGAGDQPGERPGDEREYPGRVHPSTLSVGVELVADFDPRPVVRRGGPGRGAGEEPAPRPRR